MRIRSLTMQNFRGFADATIDLDRPLTVICGVNGAGKSSVLTACAYALSRVFVEADRLTEEDDEGLWYQFPDDTDIRKGAGQASVKATVSNGEASQEVGVAYPRHSPSGIDSELVRLHRAAPALAVFYETQREVAGAKDAFALGSKGSAPSSGQALFTRDALAAGHLKFRSLFQWFKAREDVENELKVARQDLSLEDPQLAVVRRAVAGMLPGFSGLRIQRDPLHMVIRKGETVLLVDQLSDGEKLLVALTADLARRLAIAYAGRGDPLQGEAVVLIDEIELHLHPDWQRRVLPSLRRTFPNCQIIVTTHSPQVLSEVPNEAVVLLDDFQFFRPAAPTAGRDSNSILWEVLGVDARPHAVVEEIEAISSLLDDAKNDEAKVRLDHLAASLTERDPEILRLRGLLDVGERLDARDQQGE
jgi:predicted ATP-binding protein involved in virulence